MKENKEVLKEQETQVEPQAAEVVQEEQKAQVVVASEKGLRLRVGPAVSYDILKILPDKTAVDVLPMPSGAEVPGWVPVSADGQTGWVMAQYLNSAE